MRRPIKPAKRRIQPAHAKRHRGFAYEGVGGICSETRRMYNTIDIAEWFSRYMDEELEWADHLIASQLKRIADTLERLLKISEMSL